MPQQQRISQEMRKCIDDCITCFAMCSETLQHCLTLGGEHAKKNHIALLNSCADICEVAAKAMLHGSPAYVQICDTCAIVCDACAKSCESMDDDFTRDCADVCHTCGESCRNMSGGGSYMPLSA